MDKRSVLVVSLLSLFLLFSFRGYALLTVSNPWKSPDPATYNPGATYRFNVTVCDNTSTISTVLFEWNGETRVITENVPHNITCWNFTATKTDLVANETGWSYKWFANNTLSETAELSYTYIINKANNPILLEFNNGTTHSNQNITITYGTLMSASGICFAGTCNLYRNNINVSSENGQYVLLGANADGYEYKVNAIGNQNYSDNSTGLIYYAFVNKANPNINLLIDGVSKNVTADRNWTINFTAYADNPYVNVFLNTNLLGWILQNGTPTVYNKTKLTQADGVYDITAYIVDNENYSADSITYYLNINETTPTYSSSSVVVNPPHNSQYISNQVYQFNITWQDGSLDNVTFNIYNTSVLDANSINKTFNSILNSTNLTNYTVDNNTRIFSVNVYDLPKGNYNYVWTAFDTFNKNSSIFSSYTVAPKDITSNISLSISSTSLPSGGGSVAASCSASSYPVNLTLNFVGFTSNTSNKGDAVYLSGSILQTTDISCYVSGNANYTGSKIGSVFVASSSPSPIPGQSPGPTQNTTPGSFIIYGLTPTLSINLGESKQVSFTLKNTLGKGAIANVTISVKGIDSSWYTPLSKINYSYNNILQTLTLTFKIPSDAEAKDYTVKIAATGKLVVNSSIINTPDATMKLTVASPQPIQPLPSQTVGTENTTEQQNETANITSNQTASGATGLAATFEFFKNNLVIILAIAACLLIFIFRNNLTTALTGTLGKEEAETHKAKTASPLKGIKDKFDYKLVVNLKKESKAKNLKEPTEVQGAEKVPEMAPEKQPKRPAVLEKEIKRDIKELQSILDAENKVKKNKKKFNLGNN